MRTLQPCGSLDDGCVPWQLRWGGTEAGVRGSVQCRQWAVLAIQVPDCAADAFLSPAGELSKRQWGAIQAYAKRAGFEIAAGITMPR